MKSLLSTLTLFISLSITTLSNAQIMTLGISPAPIVFNYGFSWADPTGGDWSTPNFNIPGTFVQDTLMLGEDGTPGINPQGHPVSQEGCFPIINNLTGKIAVLYRNSCEFSQKVLNAQNAGAIGVILINNTNAVIGMGGGTYGLSVTIPVVMINDSDGALLVNEMGNGPVVVFLGNKIGAFTNDIGGIKAEALVSPYGGANSAQFDGFDLGLEVYNYGSAVQNNVSVRAKIDGPGGNVYDDTVTIGSMISGSSTPVFNGNTFQFPTFNLGGVGNYPIGLYTLTYTLSLGGVDDSDFDNELVSTFTVENQTLSASNTDLAGLPFANNYPSNSTTEYQACTMVQENNIGSMTAEGMYFIPHTDTAINDLVGAEIFANLYQWDDGWDDLDDPAYQFDPIINDAFQNLTLISFGTHYPSSNDEVNDVAYVAFGTSVVLQDSVRYLFCLQTFESATISFGYDNTIDYSGNEDYYRQPVSPVHVDGNWFVGGWNGQDAPSIAIKTYNCPGLSIDTTDIVKVCYNSADGMIAASANGFNGTPSYLWSTGSTNDTITNLAPGVYTLSVSDSTGCALSASFTVESQLNLTLGSVDETCFATNDGIAHMQVLTGLVGPPSYLWGNGDTTAFNMGLDNGYYTLTVIDSIGCTATEGINVGTGTVDFSLATQANVTSGFTPLIVEFDNQTPNPTNYNFTWFFGDGSTEQNNASTVSHTYMTDGTWDVMLIAVDTASGCTDTLSMNNYISSIPDDTSIDEITNGNEFSVHPNPNNGTFMLEMKEGTTTFEVNIYNVQGQIVYSDSFTEGDVNIDIQHVNSGIYLIEVRSEQAQSIIRIVKQ
jgi:hypothetical protein